MAIRMTQEYTAGWNAALEAAQEGITEVRGRLEHMDGPGDADESLRVLQKRLTAMRGEDAR